MTMSSGSMRAHYSRVHSRITVPVEARGRPIQRLSHRKILAPSPVMPTSDLVEDSVVNESVGEGRHLTARCLSDNLRSEVWLIMLYECPAGCPSCLAEKDLSHGCIYESKMRHPACAEGLSSRHTSYPAIPISPTRQEPLQADLTCQSPG